MEHKDAIDLTFMRTNDVLADSFHASTEIFLLDDFIRSYLCICNHKMTKFVEESRLVGDLLWSKNKLTLSAGIVKGWLRRSMTARGECVW